MAWTTPRTWVASEFVTASMLNTHIRDNFNALTQQGTWTPILGGATSQTGQTYALQTQGHYIRIGKFVFCTARITLVNKGTITGILQIKGLPFQAAASSGNSGVMVVAYFANMTTSFSSLTGQPVDSSTVVNLFGVAAAGATAMGQLTTGDISNTTDLVVQITYETDAA